ncbi:MAG TPA: nuclear transport factor 2 family protein [Spirochaetota bacterium]|nr:nuclear transport factor 2 family protein [Spirochaetota bacterium]HNT12984.1 nuclear transport factor 2 family protein [Spirochaetota bacterium]
MILNDAINFCNNWLPSWTGNEPDKLIKYYSPDAFYRDPTVKNGLKGHDQLKPYFTKLLKNNPTWQWTHEEIIPTEQGFCLKWKAIIPVKDKRIIEYGMDIVEIQNNVISRNEVYFDTFDLLNALRGTGV